MKENIRLVQLIHPEKGRKLAIVEEPLLVLLNEVDSVYHLALKAIDSGKSLLSIIELTLSNEKIEYDLVYNGNSKWKLLPSFDNPDTTSNCIVSGTGLTHHSSALNRNVMHQTETGTLTDSMKVYQWGLEGGKPGIDKIGVQPEWFYKGTGSVLKGHGDSLTVPAYGNDGGEEPEIAGIYIVDKNGQPVRIGFTTGNEFSDHVMEKKNYLYLAPSKLRSCSIGPELVLTTDFEEVHGTVSITRNGTAIWSKDIHSGEKNMAHTLQNLEHHHFKYPGHRIPLQAHVHFYGADAFSYGEKIQLQDGDIMNVHWEELGRTLQNPLQLAQEEDRLVVVDALL